MHVERNLGRARRIALAALKILLPDETVQGEPFWAIMEVRDGQVTDLLWTRGPDDSECMPFFPSKALADAAWAEIPDAANWVVRGISRRHMKVLLALYKGHVKFGIALEAGVADGQMDVVLVEDDALLPGE